MLSAAKPQKNIRSLAGGTGRHPNEQLDEENPMKTEPKVTVAEVKSWCPKRLGGDQPDGIHAQVPALVNENAKSRGKDVENLKLRDAVLAALRQIKPGDSAGPRFVLQWRIFPNASNPNSADPNQCGCGCSCGCSC
jgi:hypothetical protein